jgi:hypothetical protein
VVNGFGFSDDGDVARSRAITAILQPSACVPQPRPPPPHRALLKTKAKVQFDRAVTERSKVFFCVFGGQICLNFSLVFSLLLFGRQRVANCEVARRKTGAPPSPVLAWRGGISPAAPCHRFLPMAEGRSPERDRRGPAQPGAERSKSSEASPKLADC